MKKSKVKSNGPMPDWGVAILGCGSIGGILANAIDRGNAGKTNLITLFDSSFKKAEELSERLSSSPSISKSIQEVIENREVDIVVEAASQKAVRDYAVDILRSDKDVIVLSVGAFADKKLLDEVRDVAEKRGRRICIPSGAILGLDGVQAAGIADIEEVSLTTRKPPKTLSTTKFVKERNIDISSLEKPKVIFEGVASEAVEQFPESVNVAASLSLAGIGFKKTKVKIIADPSLSQNFHEIRVKGEAGEFETKAHDFPSPENPKTSYLAALSTIRTLSNLTGSFLIGI